MATSLKRKSSKGIGTANTQVGGYAAPTVTTGVYITGLVVCNTSGTQVNVTVSVFDGTTAFNLCNQTPIPGGGNINLADHGNRIVLNANDQIQASSSAASSVDVTMSVMEIQ